MHEFDRNVFINCPFDEDFAPLLQAIIFTVMTLGLEPRLATERNDSGETRLDKIKELIEQSRFSIHDLSRCIAQKKGEMFRLNMPFELGIDYGCRQYLGGDHLGKRFLILEEERYRFQAALSDISGSDIKAHAGDYEKAIRIVRDWLRSEAEIKAPGPAALLGQYVTFQEWHYERLLDEGYSDDDIQEYPTFELLESIRIWISQGKPVQYLRPKSPHRG
ncbi:hypothetical protein FTO60_05410 [Octadecabacter sp. SW4]|uniref:hypothetical protein n=1 Tax=Octadecabacter sp. SW4 TaxID=2602067 RepID=UPI0011C1D8B6|nr:hypothetical protein [Octadecabacter sp. SW4]QEE35199.1 hypothetical protein FTO60_05410 [Octadecabacter sp. SW4]